ncbi:MAG: 2-oxoacid:ferredoxin oxidoreductase subunit beta [Planctomycetota bacterium]
MATDTPLPTLKAKDFSSDQDVRWCPGCGDYSILNAVQRVCANIKATRENSVFISGIGCSSRFPYYMDTYGFHTIHGRAPGFVTGVKMANPDLDVWMITGDGDGLSIGGNHLMHILRRNVNVNAMLFNNRIYGLTKGQYSPTSEVGKKTKSTPMGSLDFPINPLSLALAAEATFVARSTDKDRGLVSVLERAADHKGSSFVEIYQNCNIFNDGAFDFATGRDVKDDNVIYLEHGKPMVFGNDKDKGLRLVGNGIEVVKVGEAGVSQDDLLIHDETNKAVAVMLAEMHYPDFPEALGVLYREEKPTYENLLHEQVDAAIEKKGEGTLEALFNAGDTYEVA